MKKLMITGAVIAAVLIGGLVFLQNVNINRLGADQYFTQIEGQGKKLEYKVDGGEVIVSYEYELPAFNKDGKEQKLTFTSHKQLREKAYLTLFVKDERGVTSYQEVKKEELPVKANEKLN